MEKETLFELILAANYLDIKVRSLLDNFLDSKVIHLHIASTARVSWTSPARLLPT